MREIVIISGKGGTGKTSCTAALAHIAGSAVICDLDVDAPDLHLLLRPTVRQRQDFFAGHEAVIDPEVCERCGTCATLCQFEAICGDGGDYRVVPWRCEGCKVCVAFCPAQAIRFPERHCGHWFVSDSRFGTFVHAQLFPGAENSGKLVMLLKQQARDLALAQGAAFILADGPPGLGCPVISSLSGAHLAVVVSEPTPAGRHDLVRVIELCRHFQIPTAVMVNKSDLFALEAERLTAFCRDQGVPLLARLPHDPVVTEAMVQGLAVTELPDSSFASLLREAWEQLVALVADTEASTACQSRSKAAGSVNE
ncbi:MAG: ATP-binding protein [Desulfobacca sp.]|uniref:ATP-binding protein n=1 Tax=Desulfobacca sp. TaxID=2067990 RepID=UPI00404B2834